MTKARLERGRLGEDLAARWYDEHGYRIADRNWRCRQGEIDLIALARGVVVFCEVKTRSSERFGSPAEAVTPSKQQRIRLLARLWLHETNVRRRVVRFDVAAVMLGSGSPRIEVLEGVF